MKEVIFLVVSERRVERMTKSMPSTHRGETVVKLSVSVSPKAFEPPVLSQEIIVSDWREGIDLGDVEFRENIITGEEAELIRQKRLAKMKEILEGQGYTITNEEQDDAK